MRRELPVLSLRPSLVIQHRKKAEDPCFLCYHCLVPFKLCFHIQECLHKCVRPMDCSFVLHKIHTQTLRGSFCDIFFCLSTVQTNIHDKGHGE